MIVIWKIAVSKLDIITCMDPLTASKG